jgi:site-specific recombinase XerD
MPSKISFLEVESVAAVAERWRASLTAQRKSPKTIESYLAATSALSDYLRRSGMPESIANVRREHVEAFITTRLGETTVRGALRSVNSVAIEYRSLRVFFRYAIDEGEIRTSPMDKMHPPKPADTLTPVIDDDQMRRLLKVTEGTTFEARRDRAMLLLLLDTGMRRTEIATLTVDAVDLTAGCVFVKHGKGDRERQVPFGPTTEVALSRYLRLRSGHRCAALDAVWLGMAGPMTGSGLYQILRARARQAGVGKLHPHQFRHSFAHRYLESGGQEGDLMMLAGWNSRAMLARYGRAVAGDRARAAYRAHSPVEGLTRGGR